MRSDGSDVGWWTMERGASPVLATAIHAGHGLDADLEPLVALSPAARLREEDPFTDRLIRDAANRIVCHRSRFQVDLNRARDEAVYLTPGQAWGLEVWRAPPPAAVVARAGAMHDAYYAMLRTVLEELEREHGRFVVLDVHSYNHRRDGAYAPPAPAEAMPEVNIGTASMDRARWAHVVDPFMDALRAAGLEVRENVAFQGRGEQTRFVHATFPETGCAIAVEFKKAFMDEWTGAPDPVAIARLRAAVRDAVPVLETAIRAEPAGRAAIGAGRSRP